MSFRALLLCCLLVVWLSPSPVSAASRFGDGDLDALCQRYRSDIKSPLEQPVSAFIGTPHDVASCKPSSLNDAGKNAMMSALSYYRNLAGLSAVTKWNQEYASGASDCTLMIDSSFATGNGKFSHGNWNSNDKCYTRNGHVGCQTSNLALTSNPTHPVKMVMGFVDDNGDRAGGIGHRLSMFKPKHSAMGGAVSGIGGALRLDGDNTFNWNLRSANNRQNTTEESNERRAKDKDKKNKDKKNKDVEADKKAIENQVSSFSWPPAGAVPIEAVGNPKWWHVSLDDAKDLSKIITTRIVDLQTGATVGGLQHRDWWTTPRASGYFLISGLQRRAPGCYAVDVQAQLGSGAPVDDYSWHTYLYSCDDDNNLPTVAECDALFQQWMDNKGNEASPDGVSVPLSAQDTAVILEKHNALRASVNPPALNMPALVYDASLANAWDNMENTCHNLWWKSSRDSAYGWNYAADNSNDLGALMEQWAKGQGKYYYPSFGNGGGACIGRVCGPYKNIIQDRATRVGCRLIDCTDSKGPDSIVGGGGVTTGGMTENVHILVCAYDAKLIASKPPYVKDPSPPPPVQCTADCTGKCGEIVDSCGEPHMCPGCGSGMCIEETCRDPQQYCCSQGCANPAAIDPMCASVSCCAQDEVCGPNNTCVDPPMVCDDSDRAAACEDARRTQGLQCGWVSDPCATGPDTSQIPCGCVNADETCMLDNGVYQCKGNRCGGDCGAGATCDEAADQCVCADGFHMDSSGHCQEIPSAPGADVWHVVTRDGDQGSGEWALDTGGAASMKQTDPAHQGSFDWNAQQSSSWSLNYLAWKDSPHGWRQGGTDSLSASISVESGASGTVGLVLHQYNSYFTDRLGFDRPQVLMSVTIDGNAGTASLRCSYIIPGNAMRKDCIAGSGDLAVYTHPWASGSAHSLKLSARYSDQPGDYAVVLTGWIDGQRVFTTENSGNADLVAGTRLHAYGQPALVSDTSARFDNIMASDATQTYMRFDKPFSEKQIHAFVVDTLRTRPESVSVAFASDAVTFEAVPYGAASASSSSSRGNVSGGANVTYGYSAVVTTTGDPSSCGAAQSTKLIQQGEQGTMRNRREASVLLNINKGSTCTTCPSDTDYAIILTSVGVFIMAVVGCLAAALCIIVALMCVGVCTACALSCGGTATAAVQEIQMQAAAEEGDYAFEIERGNVLETVMKDPKTFVATMYHAYSPFSSPSKPVPGGVNVVEHNPHKRASITRRTPTQYVDVAPRPRGM